MKFTKLYENLKLLDICKPVSPEEYARRDEAGPLILIKEVLDAVNKTTLPDGTWHVHDNLDVSNIKMANLTRLNVSIVDKTFNCNYAKLTSLEGCPKIVKGTFSCTHNQLTSLEGGPTEVKSYYYCNDNQLTSLKGSPDKLRKDFFCYRNNLTSLKGCPKEVNGVFMCSQNIKQFTTTQVKALCNVKGFIIT